MELASSFGSVAAAYAEHRPDYASDAVRWAVGDAARVLDLGAGTGKLTAVLATLDVEVVAVEPDAAMLAELHVPGVRALTGSAETIPLPDAAVDAVVAGNAMHWFDMALAGPEIARVLDGDGVLAGLWNVLDDRVGWVAGLQQVAGPEAIGPRDTLSAWSATGAHLPAGGFGAHFGAVERAEFEHGQRRTAESLTATLATRAGMVVMPEAERDGRLGATRAFLAAVPETAGGEFTLPMLTCVLRVRRLR